MASVVCVDDVLLFGSDEKKKKEVLKRLELQKSNFKLEKDAKDDSHDFLGINIVQTEKNGAKSIEMTQSGPNQEVPGTHRHV